MDTIIEFENITFSYGEIPAVKEISLKVDRGGFVAIVGPNGSGKSTCLLYTSPSPRDS